MGQEPMDINQTVKEIHEEFFYLLENSKLFSEVKGVNGT
jgi:hypothetical protein